jgi:acyl-CoA thioester hydrolase
MSTFRFYQPIEVRYGDLDPQGHVNNASYLTYMEQARIEYVRHLGLWTTGSFLEFGLILADAQVTFIKPVLFGQPLRVGARVTRLGNKSLTMEYALEDARDGRLFATGTTVLVAYDYHKQASVPIPADWRTAIRRFEELKDEPPAPNHTEKP